MVGEGEKAERLLRDIGGFLHTPNTPKTPSSTLLALNTPLS